MTRPFLTHPISDDSALGGTILKRSLRFNRTDTPYLQTTLGNGDEDKWTWSAWVKKTINGQHQNLFSSGSSSVYTHINFDNQDRIRFQNWHSGQRGTKITTRKIRDLTSWMHIVIIWDSGNATADDRMRIYVNGTRETAFDDSTNPDQNQDSVINGNSLGGSTYGNGKHSIGRFADTSDHSGTYKTEINFVDGYAYDPSFFGYTDFQTGIWKPKKYEGVYGSNGFRLPLDSTKIVNEFIDESSSANTITTGGNAVHSTDQTKNGVSSIKFDGTGDKLTANNSDFVFGTSDFTVEAWVYKLDTSLGFIFGQTNNDAGGRSGVAFGYQSGALWLLQGNGSGWNIETTQGTFPRNQWVHIAVSRDYSETKTYYFINGSLVYTYTSNVNLPADNSGDISIGSINTAAYDWDGYIDQVRISNTARYTSNFTPPTAHFTSDANTKFLVQSNVVPPYAGSDKSGNGNDFTLYNFSTKNGAGNDSLEDTPTNNFSTINPLAAYLTNFEVPSNGNLDFSLAAAEFAFSSFEIPSSGKWYAEVVFTTHASGRCGIANLATKNANRWHGIDNLGGSIRVDDSAVQTGISPTIGDNKIVGIKVDRDAGTIAFTVDGSAAGTAVNISSMSNPENLVFAVGRNSSSGSAPTGSINFGQRPFSYLPTGYQSLCSNNLTPTVPSIIRPQKHFDIITYTGDGSNNRKITGLEFTPDMIWIKSRSNTDAHVLQDIIRTNGLLYPNQNSTEGNTGGGWISSFNVRPNDGFTINSNGPINTNSQTYVAWCWKAGGTAVTNNDGNNTSQVSVNTEAGFSILTYTGNGTNNSNITMGHGLGKTPAWVIIKNRSSTADWVVWVRGIGGSATDNQKNLGLNTSSAAGQNSSQFRYADSSIIAVRDADSNGNVKVNKNGDNYVAYCWAEIPGYSKFGVYRGNGNANGTYVHVGFKPDFVLIKNYGAGGFDWVLQDGIRDTSNPTAVKLNPNQSAAEQTGNDRIDILSNGFKCRDSSAGINASGSDYAYIAFAEQSGSTAYDTEANAR